jgi:uncharacterized protein YbcI
MPANEPWEQDPPADDEELEPRTGQLRQVTRAMISIYKNHFGRGPRNAHSHYAGPNILICVLEGTHTPVEQSLVRIGQEQRLQDIRQLFQTTTEARFRSTVEEIIGRKTIGFMSGNDVRNDLASEIFVLEPAD